MNIEKEKELFLEWLKKEQPMMYQWCLDGVDEYKTKVDYMFLAWQASVNREGYKLVPIEPTENMIVASFAHRDCDDDYCIADIYKEMLGACDEH